MKMLQPLAQMGGEAQILKSPLATRFTTKNDDWVDFWENLSGKLLPNAKKPITADDGTEYVPFLFVCVCVCVCVLVCVSEFVCVWLSQMMMALSMRLS